MIDSTVEKLAYERAQQLEGQGVFATARSGTPLEMLVSELLPGSEAGNLYVTENYTNLQCGFADELADHVRRYLDFARNTAKPALVDVQERVQAAIASITNDPFSGLNIVELELPALFADDDFARRIETSTAKLSMPKEALRFTERTDAELLELCSTGVQSWDDSFAAWVKKQPEGSLQKVWQAAFQNPTLPKSTDVIPLDRLYDDYTDGKCSALIIFLLSQRLLQGLGEDCGVSLETARSILYAMSGSAAYAMQRAIEWSNSFVTTNTLVADARDNNRLLRVNSQVYKEFQANGGNVEVLMGMLVAGKNYQTVAQINENAEDLLKEWTHYTLSRTEASQAEYELNIRSAMKIAFEASLDVSFGDLETDMLAKPGTRENALRVFNEELANASREEIHNNWIDVLWRAACKGRYYYFTFIYDLLDSIDYGVTKQGLDADSAARIATQKIVVKFVVEQMQPV